MTTAELQDEFGSDKELSPDMLADKYSACGEHPKHTMSKWGAAIKSRQTEFGYWSWVVIELCQLDN